MQNNKIKIAVSSCLLGEAVRYDGTDKHVEFITQQLALNYNLISLCPEMAVGMGVPRLPIHLIDDERGMQVVGIDNPEKNMTKPLTQYGNEVVEIYPDICGYSELHKSYLNWLNLVTMQISLYQETKSNFKDKY